jgi:RNA polymerase sigma-70 factor (ECF subfamily)
VTGPGVAAGLFTAHQHRLVRLAYRMLGSMAEAEDVVQEAWVRWQRVDQAEVREPGAYLSRTVTRLCLDVMKSARVRRETYVGPWLPDPIVEPEDDVARLDDLTLTLMLALERLTPLERAAFLLHDVFGLPFEEVAATLGRDGAAVRQLAARARKHVREQRPRHPVEREEGARLARAFFAASASGDVEGLRAMLAETVALRSDGGGKVIAFLNPIVGVERVLRLYAGLGRKAADHPPELVRTAWIDGLPGYVSRDHLGVWQTTAFEVEDGRIATIYITRNPDKLARIVEALEPLPDLDD